MLRLAALVAATIALSGPALPQARHEADFVKPGLAQFAVRDAVDHVAVMRVKPTWGPPGDHDVTLVRSGRWLKESASEPAASSIAFSDLDSGVSLKVTRQKGRDSALTIVGRSAGVAMTIEKTNETHRLLGETCTVSRFRWKSSAIIEDNCLTRDNILLWQRTTSVSGDDLGSARAISIVRRRVRPDEIGVPADLVRLSSWYRVRANAGAADPNDEGRLDATTSFAGDAAPDHVIVRRLGHHSAEDSTHGQGRRRRWTGETNAITLVERADGLRRLDIGPVPPAVRAAGAPLATPVAKGEIRTILGQPCRVTNMTPGMVDFSRIDCLTDDGLLLARTETGRGGTQLDVVATRVSRGTLTATEMMPPADLLDPARWAER